MCRRARQHLQARDAARRQRLSGIDGEANSYPCVGGIGHMDWEPQGGAWLNADHATLLPRAVEIDHRRRSRRDGTLDARGRKQDWRRVRLIAWLGYELAGDDVLDSEQPQQIPAAVRTQVVGGDVIHAQ